MSLRIFAIIFAFFIAWSVAKPPMQAADEFSHAARVESIPDNPWFASGERLNAPASRLNPYINSLRLRELPFHPDRGLTELEIRALKGYSWGDSDQPVEIISQSHSYATAYFAPAYVLGRTITKGFGLAPFESNWVYRLISCLFCSLIFTYFALLLRNTFPKHWVPMALLTIANPQLGFTLSSIHPDSLFTPAAAVTVLLSYRACLGVGAYRFLILAAFALLSSLAKPLGTPMSLALMIAAGVFGALFREHRRSSFFTVIALVTAMAVAQISFFVWVKLQIYGIPISLSIWEYLAALPTKPRIWFRQFFGSVGWLDTVLNAPWHALLLSCLVLNFALAVIYSFKNKDFKPWVYLGGFAVVFISGLLVGEFKYIDQAGYSVQGRYLFPLLPLVALVIRHDTRFIRTASSLFILTYVAAYYDCTVRRYFASNWSGWAENLPFMRTHQLKVEGNVKVSGTVLNGAPPPGVMAEGPLLSYNVSGLTVPTLTISSTPAPIAAEISKLPEPDLWRISILYSSPAEALSAAKTIIAR